jgi:hypothetical protein
MSCFPVHNLITVWQLGLVQRSNSWWANGYSSDYTAACGWALPWLPHQQQLDICSPSLLLPVSAWVKLAENGRKRAMSSIILSFFPTCAKELWTVWGSHGSTILWSSMVFYGLLWLRLWSTMIYYGLLACLRNSAALWDCWPRICRVNPKAQTAPPRRDWQRTWWRLVKTRPKTSQKANWMKLDPKLPSN